MDQTLKLTAGQERFCDLYLSLGNASQAYKQAFACNKLKDTIVANRAGKLLQTPEIKTKIEELRRQLQSKATITKEHLLSELETIINAKVTNYLDFDGKDINYKDFSRLNEDKLKAIESIKHGKYGIELKLHNKSRAIERLSKMLGYEVPLKNEVTGTSLLPQRLDNIPTAELNNYHVILDKTNDSNQIL
ncbi:MAG: terminase small subunit [Solitalea-like symbiont of Tyrophagus putrescentiae]